MNVGKIVFSPNQAEECEVRGCGRLVVELCAHCGKWLCRMHVNNHFCKKEG